jgi:hypothetical protein
LDSRKAQACHSQQQSRALVSNCNNLTSQQHRMSHPSLMLLLCSQAAVMYRLQQVQLLAAALAAAWEVCRSPVEQVQQLWVEVALPALLR